MIRGASLHMVIVDEAHDFAAALREFSDGPDTTEIPKETMAQVSDYWAGAWSHD